MDPYAFTQHDEFHEETEDDLKKLERELAPASSDYYGILNISKKVRSRLLLSIINNSIFDRPPRKKLKNHIKSCVASFIPTRYVLESTTFLYSHFSLACGN